MADVFISYKKEDRALAEAAVAALQGAGYSAWWDDRLTPTEHWDRLIEREIEEAKAVLVLWTERSVESDWVRIEANYGAEHSKLVQVRFGGCRPPLAHSMLQRIDLPAGARFEGDAWRKAMGWIALLSGRAAEAERAPAEAPSAAKSQAEADSLHSLFDEFFGSGKKSEPSASGDISIPLVLPLADAVQGRQLEVAPTEGVATGKRLSVQIPPGVAPGDKIRLPGHGALRPDGGGVGDLYLVLAIRDDSGFRVEGRHVLGDVRVRLIDGMMGGEEEVRLPWGPVLRVRIPAGPAEEKVLRVSGRGLPARGSEPAGDLLLRLCFG